MIKAKARPTRKESHAHRKKGSRGRFSEELSCTRRAPIPHSLPPPLHVGTPPLPSRMPRQHAPFQKPEARNFLEEKRRRRNEAQTSTLLFSLSSGIRNHHTNNSPMYMPGILCEHILHLAVSNSCRSHGT